jgi:hypothetical protein
MNQQVMPQPQPQPQSMPQPQMSPEAPQVYAAVQDQAMDSYMSATQPQPVPPVELDDEQFKNRLTSIGEEFQSGGMSKALFKLQQDQDLLTTILKKPDIIKKIQDNANPKNETPAGVGVNAVAKAVGLSDRVTDMAEKLGIDLTSGGKIPPERQGGFMNGIKQIFADSQIQPGSMEAVAQRDYFTALLTGKGVGGAMEAYGVRYNQLADETRKMRNQVFVEATKKDLEFQIKNQQQIASNRVATQTIASILTTPGANVPSTDLGPIAQEASAILASAKENPTVASGSARAMLQKLASMGVGDQQITEVARVFGDLIKTDDKKTEMYNNLSTIRGADSDGALTRWKFDIATPADNEKILKLMDKFDLRKSTQEALAAAAKQKAESQAKAQAAITPVTEGGMTPQQIEAEGKALEASALIPSKVEEQRRLMPGKVKEAGQTAGAQAAAQLPFQQKLDTFKTGNQKDLEVFKTGQEGQRVFNREAAQEVVKNIASSPELQGALNKYQKAIKVIDEGKVNIGPITSFAPLSQWMGKNAPNPTVASQNTKDVQTAIDSIVQKMAKDLGANPSDRDLQFLLNNKPSVDKDNPARIRDWLDSAAKKISRGAETATALGTAAGIQNMPKPVGGDVDQPKAPQATKVIDGVTYVYDGKGWKKQ